MNRFKFATWDSIDAEMTRFRAINVCDPEKGRNMFTKGETLVALASNGELFKMRKFIEESKSEDLLIYFVYKALKTSLAAGHLMVASYLIDSGYPINHEGLPNLMKECLSECNDYLCVAIIRLLASKGLDINKQAPINWFTALHYAVQNQRLETIELLVSLGADVNAVAEHDVMPLNVANSLPESVERLEIINKLLSCGAKTTWRRQAAVKVSFSGGGNAGVFSENTSLSVSSSGGSSHSSKQPTVRTSTEPVVERKQFVKFTGGGGDVSSVYRMGKDFDKDASVGLSIGMSAVRLDCDIDGEEEEKRYGASCHTGDDGAMLFSTGD